jgi:hypothetical protein
MSEANVFFTGDTLPPADSQQAQMLLGALLDDHAERAADRAIAVIGGPLTVDTLPRYLDHEACLRLPTRIVFDATGLDPHQFGESFLVESGGGRTCELRIHPRFAARPELVPLFVGYLSPVINYGPVVSSDLCEWYGARLTSMDRDTYYEILCRAVDDAV